MHDDALVDIDQKALWESMRRSAAAIRAGAVELRSAATQLEEEENPFAWATCLRDAEQAEALAADLEEGFLPPDEP